MRAYLGHVLTIAILGCLASAAHASTWLALRDGRFEIVTDAGESAGRAILTSLKQFDGAIAHSAPVRGVEPPSGVATFYVLRNEQEFAEFRSRPWTAGVTVSSGHLAPFVVMFAGSEAREVAFHEYVHVLAGEWRGTGTVQSVPLLPKWFEEGLAEFYGRAEVSGNRLTLGRQVREHLALLRGQPLGAELLDEPRAKNSQQLYYAVCWALVHMLLVEQPERIEVLLKASPSDAVFGKALQDLQQYVARPIWRQQAVDAPRASIEYKVEIIPAVDAEFLVATLLLDADKPEAARRHYGRLATAHRGEAIGAEASGLSALAAGEREAAKREFRRAVELRSTRARVWSELAVLEKEDGAPWEKVKPLLERAAVLDPSDFQPAYLLGVHEADDGELTNATAHLASASQAAPGKSDIWHAYALALQQANRVKEAQVAAQHAMRVAASTEWEERARVLLESLSRPAGGPAQSSVRRKPEVVTSPAWTAAQPDARAEGRFLAFDCQSTPPILRIGRRDGASDLEFKISDPRQVNLLNTGSGESSIRLDCGPQDGRPIRVGYRASDGTVLELEFLQVHDLPRF